MAANPFVTLVVGSKASPQVQESTDGSMISKFEVSEKATVVVGGCGASISGVRVLDRVGFVVEESGRLPLQQRRTPGKGLDQGSQLHPASTYTTEFIPQTLGPAAYNTTASVCASDDIAGRSADSTGSLEAIGGLPGSAVASATSFELVCAAACAINIKEQGRIGVSDHDAGPGAPGDELATVFPCVKAHDLYCHHTSFGSVGDDDNVEALFDMVMQPLPVEVKVAVPADLAHSFGVPPVLKITATTADCLYKQVGERMGLYGAMAFYLWTGIGIIPDNDASLEALGIGQGSLISWCLGCALAGGSANGGAVPASPKASEKAISGEQQTLARDTHSTLVTRLAEKLVLSKCGDRPSTKNRQTAYDTEAAKVRATVTEALSKRVRSVFDTARLHALLPEGQASILSLAAPVMAQNPCAYLTLRDLEDGGYKCLSGCAALVSDEYGISAEVKIGSVELEGDVVAIRGTVASGALSTIDGMIDDNLGTLRIMFDKMRGGVDGATAVVFRSQALNVQEFVQLTKLSVAAKALHGSRERKRGAFGIEAVANAGKHLLCLCISIVDAWLGSVDVKVEDYLFGASADDDGEDGRAGEAQELRGALATVLCDTMKAHVKKPCVLAHMLFDLCALRLGQPRSASAPPEGGVFGQPALPDKSYLDQAESATNLLRTVALMVATALGMDTKAVASELAKSERFKAALSKPLSPDQDLQADGYQRVFVDTVKEFLTNTKQEVATALGSRPSIGEGLEGVRQAFEHMIDTSFTPGSMAGNEFQRVVSQFMGSNGVGLANIVVVDLVASGAHIVASTHGTCGLDRTLPTLMIDLHGSHYEAVHRVSAGTWQPPNVWQEQVARQARFGRTLKMHRALVAKSAGTESRVEVTVSKCQCGKGMRPDAKCCVACAALTWVPEATGDKRCLACGDAVTKDKATAMHCASCFAKATKSAQQQAVENQKRESEQRNMELAALDKQVKLLTEKHAAEMKLVQDRRQVLSGSSQRQPPPVAAKTCACGNAVASSNPAHTKCQGCFNKARAAQRGQVSSSQGATASKPAAKAPAAQASHVLLGMPRVQQAFDQATARFGPRQAEWLAEKVRKAHKQGVPHASIAHSLESGQCIFADKCNLPGCERHGHVGAPAPVSPPSKKIRSAKKKAAASAPASAPKTAPAAAVAAPVGAGQFQPQQPDLATTIAQIQQSLQQLNAQFLKLSPPGAVAGNVSA
jgi:hypothetical protein